MDYNAVVRYEGGKVIGKLSVSNLKHLPNKWEVIYGHYFIPRNTDMKSILSDRNFPLSIYTTAMIREITVVAVGFLGCLKFSVRKFETVRMLKRLISEKMRIEFQDQWKLFLLDETNTQPELEVYDQEFFEDILFQPKGTVRLEMQTKEEGAKEPWYWSRAKLMKRGVFSLPETIKIVDLQSEHVQKAGSSVKNEWEGYSFGLNIYGTCPNESCPSHKISCGQTIHRGGYAFRSIDPYNKEFPCSACKLEPFLPRNFVVSAGRALFRFRKPGGSSEVQSTLLESFGGINEFVMFRDGGPELEYSCEVNTVRKDESLHVCVRCDKQIKKKVDEVLYDCSHAVHRLCLEETCCVCKADVLTDAQVKALARSSHQQSRLGSRGSTQGTAVASTSRQQSELVLFDPLTSSSESD